MFTFIVSSNNISMLLNFTSSVFYSISIFFAFLFISIDLVTSIFVNELIIDSTTQEIRLLNVLSANAEIELITMQNFVQQKIYR